LAEVASFSVDGELFKSLVNAMVVVHADFIQFTRRAMRVVSMDPSRVMLLNVSLAPVDYRCDVDSLWVETSAHELERVAKKIKKKELLRCAVVDDKFNVGSFEKVGWVIKEEDVSLLLKENREGLERLEKSSIDAKLRVILPTFRRIVKSAEAMRLTERWARHFEYVGLRVEEREGNIVFFSDEKTYSRVDIRGFVDWVLEVDGRAKVLYGLERFSSLLLLGFGEVATLEVRMGGVLRVNYAGNFWNVDLWLASVISEESMKDFEAILVAVKPPRKFVWRLTGESVKDFVKVLRAVAPTTFDNVNMGGIGDTWWVYWKNGCAGFVKMDKYSFDEFVYSGQTAFGQFSLSDLISFLKDAEKVECFLEGEPAASLVLVASGAKIVTKESKSEKLIEVVAVPEVKGVMLFSGLTETLTSICEDAITAKDEFLIFISAPFEITVLGRNKIYYEAALPVDSFRTIEEDYIPTRHIEGLKTFFANIPAEVASVGKEDYHVVLEAQPRIAYVKAEIFQTTEELTEAITFYEEYRKPPPPPKPTEITPLAPLPPEVIREPTQQDIVAFFTPGVMWSEESFFAEVKRKGFSVPKASEILAKLEREGVIYEPRPRWYARTEAPPIKLTAEDTGRLADFFLDKLRKAGVYLPTQYKGEFEKAMDIYKSYEENVAIIEKVADDIIRRVAPPIEVVGSDYTHDMLVAEGWTPIISIPRLEEALKAPGKGGHSTPELALEMAKRQYSPELYDFKVVKHYALHGEFPYTVFVKTKVPPAVPKKVSREEFMRAFDEALYEWIPDAIEGHKPGLSGRLHYEAPEFEAETLAKFSMDTVLSKWENVIAKEKEEVYERYSQFAETAPEHAKRILADVPERARHLASSLVGKTDTQLFEEAKAKVARPMLSEEDIKRLEDVFRATLSRELGRIPRDVMAEFRVEIDALKFLPYEQAKNRIEALAKEIIDKERAPARPKPPVAPPPPVEIPVEAPPEVFIEPTTPPKEPISPLPFPRSPTTEERERLWRAFMYEMSRIGQDPYRWREAFRMHVLDRPYRFWGDLLSNFKEFVEAIRTGREFRLLPLVTLPMPWRAEEEQRKYDAILHFIATKLYPSMDELVHALFTYGMEVTEDDVKKAVKKGFAEKNLWLTSVSKETLESLAGETL